MSELARSVCWDGRVFKQFGDARVYGAPFVGYACAGEDFVGEIEDERAFFHDEREKVENVARVEIAGVDGDFGGQVERREEGDAADGLRDAGPGQLAVAAGGGGEIDEDGAGAHGFDGGAADEARSRPAGDLRGGDDDVGVGGGSGDEVAAAVEGFLGEFGGVTASAFGADAAQVNVEELCAEGAD